MMSANATEQGGDLKAIRKARGLSQQRVAELARCSVSYVRVLESGYQPANASDVLARIATVLNTSEAALVGGSAKSPVTAGNGES